MHTENHLPKFPGTSFVVPGWWVGVFLPIIMSLPTPFEVEMAVTALFLFLSPLRLLISQKGLS